MHHVLRVVLSWQSRRSSIHGLLLSNAIPRVGWPLQSPFTYVLYRTLTYHSLGCPQFGVLNVSRGTGLLCVAVTHALLHNIPRKEELSRR